MHQAGRCALLFPMKLRPKIGRPFGGLYALFYLNPEERLCIALLLVILTVGSVARWHHLRHTPEQFPALTEETP